MCIRQFHRDHARIELTIRDLKDGAGLEHCPSGRFFANAAWLACTILAHNIARWTDQLGGTRHGDQLTVARTVRSRLIALPGRLVNQRTLYPPAPRQLALGHSIHRCASPPPQPPAGDLNTHSGQARPHTTTTR